MTRLALILTAAILAAAWADGPVVAAPGSMCADIVTLIEEFDRDHGESPVARWRDSGGDRVLMVNLALDTWTLLMVDQNGYACTMRHGNGVWLAPAERGEPA